jgi:hypothetical protein
MWGLAHWATNYTAKLQGGREGNCNLKVRSGASRAWHRCGVTTGVVVVVAVVGVVNGGVGHHAPYCEHLQANVGGGLSSVNNAAMPV